MAVKISVIVAVHNDEKNLRNTLDSIKNQSLKEIEVIIIDAASTDSSREIIKSYMSDKRFSFYSVSSYSFSVARNLGIEQAKGKYISFSDASIVYSKNFLENMYDCAEKENAQLCVAPMNSYDI